MAGDGRKAHCRYHHPHPHPGHSHLHTNPLANPHIHTTTRPKNNSLTSTNALPQPFHHTLKRRVLRILHVLNLVKIRKNQRTARAKSARQSTRYLLEGIGAVLTILGVASFLVAAYLYAGLVSDLPSTDAIPLMLNPVNGSVLSPTILTDSSGEHEIYRMEIPGWQRKMFPIDPLQPDFISTQLVRLTVSSTQPDFWQSSGVNGQKLTASQPSTIAEHLASNLLLEQEPTSLRRALRMRLLALQLTAKYGHSQILEWYLNSLEYGHQAYGAPSAARLFLDRPVSQLTISESALLIASSRTPALNPIDSPAAALENRDQLLHQFAENGIINQEELKTGLEEKLSLQKSVEFPESIAPAFTRLALQQAYDQLGRQRVERGGLVIRTSMDYDLQVQARCAAQVQLQHLTGSNALDEEKCKAARSLPALPPGTSFLMMCAPVQLLWMSKPGRYWLLSATWITRAMNKYCSAIPLVHCSLPL